MSPEEMLGAKAEALHNNKNIVAEEALSIRSYEVVLRAKRRNEGLSTWTIIAEGPQTLL